MSGMHTHASKASTADPNDQKPVNANNQAPLFGVGINSKNHAANTWPPATPNPSKQRDTKNNL